MSLISGAANTGGFAKMELAILAGLNRPMTAFTLWLGAFYARKSTWANLKFG